MMKIMLSLLFLIFLCFSLNFWIMQFSFFLLTFIFMINFNYNFIFIDLSYNFGHDLLSYALILLSFWICSLMIMSMEKLYKFQNFYNLFMFIMIILMMSLLLAFSSLNLFLFYVFFEISLIPTLFLILGWGYQPERIEAGVYLLFYTLLMSLPMMISIFFLYKNFFIMEFYFLKMNINNIYLYMFINLVFFVKLPMFFIHLWLPKAHVEAPVAGSMILAGIMLKLGGYGLLRLMKLFIELGLKINFIFIIISLIGGFFVSLICMRQSDMKSLIAYSSVAHMGLILGGVMTLNNWGLWGSLMMMLAHGLCSSGLFCLANIVYERIGSRSLYLNKGLLNLMPSMSFWWFLFCSSNMAAPPSLNLLSEIMLINSLMSFSWLSIIFLSLISFFSAVYSLFLYSFSQHGKFYSGLFSIYQGSFREYLLLFLHWFPLNILILKSEFLIFWV
uniref:NADH-ubiquinone oxidoreductase chain 4 n=1 Tax=Spondylis buprestoides TaxID=1395520 RepID=A0A7H0R0C0_9CUCU|nr:NADH dehydrogenase subunit 4 [Spondylis buprestoides]QNQ64869.1 NADH dehydrogenase subunit 4 [Spondylis buprestoides]